MKLSKAEILWNESELERLKPSPYHYNIKIHDGHGNANKTISINEETFQKIKRLLTN
jgi:hypothetical protein